MKKLDRVEKIKRKFGKDAFRKFGKLGGNELLKAQGRGDKIIIVKRKQKG